MKYSEFLRLMRATFVAAALATQFIGMLTNEVLPELFAFVCLICAVLHDVKLREEIKYENEEAEEELQKIEHAKLVEDYYDRRLARSKEFKNFVTRNK